MAINETLKFSWGHIIAFVVLIFISYVSFMGITYLTDGDFLYAGVGVLIINLLLIIFFILPQILKGTDEKFSRKIVFERILFFCAPVVFVVAMMPYAHFWNVFEKRSQIETTFSESIKTSKGMFESYETYADARIKNYDKKLAREKLQPVARDNKVEALKLQLVDKNYTSLKNSAFEWIDNASGATVWNVFMIGNVKKNENALDVWNSSLTVFSNKKMADEDSEVVAFSSTDKSVNVAKDNLSSLRGVYTLKSGPTVIALLIGLLLYFLLLFPYIIQSRNTKSTYRLIDSEDSSYTPRKQKKVRKKNVERQDYMTINVNDEDASSNSDDYDSFTM